MATRFLTHVQTGVHGARPGAATVPQGTLFACTTHSLIYQSDGVSTWSTWYSTTGVASFGSNSNAVGEANAPGAHSSNARADHVHLGVRTVSHASNTFAGPITLTASGALGITSPTPGTLNLSSIAGTSGGGGGLADQGTFTYLDAAEAAAPGTPASGKVRIYAKSDGRVYSKDDAGVEYGPFDAAGGGAGGSDYISIVSADTDLIHYWPCNEANGSTTFADVIGSSNLGAYGTPPAGGPSLTNDWANGGSVGTHGDAQGLTRSPIAWPSAWTIAAWVNITYPAADVMLVGQWDGSGSMIYMSDADSVRIYAGGTYYQWDAPSAYDVKGRHFIAVTLSGTTLRLIWDGDEKTSGTVTAPTSSAGGAFSAGRYSGSTGARAGVWISDIAFYDVAKSESDLLALYNLGTS